MLYKIKSIVSSQLKKQLEQLELNKLIPIYKNQEKVIFLSTPEHGNLGDHAITIAIKKIIEEKYPNKLILEFSFNEYNRNQEKIEKIVNSKDIIYLVGGGNFGNLYSWEEIQRRDILKRFLNNKIIIMPQSLSYTDDTQGKKELDITKNIAKEHKKLTIIARDEKSYAFAKENFSYNNIIMAPDSVLYMEDYYLEKMKQNRRDVIFTIRKDKEKILSDKKIKEIQQILDKNNILYKVDDTTVSYGVNRKTRDYEVENILRKISGAKLNITDRFHGVIFSVITNTPVIVFKSLDHKISEGIKWFKHLDYVHYLTEDDDVEEIIKKYIKADSNIEKKEYLIKEKIKNALFSI